MRFLQLNKFTYYIIAITLYFQLSQAFAQSGGASFEQISIAQGLSDNRVEAICQDRKGFIWIGTAGGLNRYDGYNFINYGHVSFNIGASIYEDKRGSLWITKSLGGELIRFDIFSEEFIHYNDIIPSASQVFEDRNGVIWIASWENRLAKYLPEQDSFMFYKYFPGNAYNLPDISINVMLEDHNNVLWIGSSDGLYIFDRENEHFIPWEGKLKSDVLAIHEDKQGQLWIGTSVGLMMVDPLHHSEEFFENALNWRKAVSYIFEDSKGRIWTGNWGSLFQFDRTNKKFIAFPSVNELSSGITWALNPIKEDKNGTVWTCINLAPFWFDEGEQNFKIFNDPTSPELAISSLYTDNSGTLWLGTMKDGLFRYNVPSRSFHNMWDDQYEQALKENGINHSVISLFKDEEGILWVGKPDGLLRIDERKGTSHLYTHQPDDPHSLSHRGICAIVEESPDILWLGTYAGGLNKFDKRTGQCERFLPDPGNPGSLMQIYVNGLLIDKSGTLWVGSGWTLEKFNPDNGTFIHYMDTLNYPGIISIYEDKAGTLWVATSIGIAIFDRSSGSFDYFKNPSSDQKILINNDINTFYEDKKGNFWVCTGNGLDKLDRTTRTFKHITANIPDKIIGILEDDHSSLWLLTPRGISNYNPGTGIVKNYDETDGVNLNSSFYYPYCKDVNGEMYFGGFKGLIKFHPDDINDNPDIPSVVITSVKVFNKDIQSDTAITEKKIIKLPYHDNSVAFEFAALEYTSRQKNQYAYKLQRIDDDWVESGTRRFASYPNLQPGKYVFRVKGSNNDGVWNETGTAITIILTPPWWKTWWAYTGYGLAILLILYGIRRYELNRLSFKNQVETDIAILKEKDETDKMKSRFFANISHEFRTPLTLIIGPAERIFSMASDDIKNDANTIKRNAKRLLQLINQLLDLSKLEAGKLNLEISRSNIVSFVKGAVFSFESLAKSKDITIKLQADKDFIEMYFDQEKMLQIFSNILSNAFKFTHEGGQITVSISGGNPSENEIQPQFVEIVINDTGIGISSEDIPRLFDRFYQVDSSFTKEHEGTGIGLALTKEFVELHHGTIRVESKNEEVNVAGSGWTKFTLTLPLGKDHLDGNVIFKPDAPHISTDHPEEREAETNLQVINGRGNLKTELLNNKPGTLTAGSADPLKEGKNMILIVEDNHDMRQFIRESLDAGYNTEEAVNGEQGVWKAEKLIPDLIISDMMMPKMDGNELVRILKNNEKTSHIPIILLTAKAGQEDRLEGLESGADDYLTKPFDHKELQVRIKNLISLRKKLQEKYARAEYLVSIINKDKPFTIDETFMLKVSEIIATHISEEEFGIEEFCNEIAMSRTQFHRKIKALTGKSASLYIRSVKLDSARKMIEEQRATISEIAYSHGFSSPAYFTRCFREEYGYPPSELIN
jgi:signal transduction histidine kinase/ligand-binding sensor domain-containing protein/DNA-binding response OmpR family regulator